MKVNFLQTSYNLNINSINNTVTERTFLLFPGVPVKCETKQKRNGMKQIETKQIETKQNRSKETKQIETKRNKSKRNETNEKRRKKKKKLKLKMGGNKLSPGSNNGKILRSGRSRRPPNTFTPSRPSVVVSNTKEMNYEFSKKKAATKKMLATLRESDVDVELKHETLVMTFSAAAYEIFKNAVFTYFKTSAERSHKIHNKTSKSNDGQIHIVEESLSFGDKNVKGQLYRLNLFHTTSRVDVNGRHMAEFVNVDVHKILDSVCTMGDLRMRILNENIHRACQKFLQSEENQNANVCKVTTVESSSRVVALNAIRDVDCIDCKVCGSKCMTKSVQCDQCLMWLHYKCVKLTKTEIDNLEKKVLCNIAHDYSTMEQYMLQPTKSVVLPVTTQKKSTA